jgi:hypothetical protein
LRIDSIRYSALEVGSKDMFLFRVLDSGNVPSSG